MLSSLNKDFIIIIIIIIKDGRSPPQFLFVANHFHIEATLESTDSDILHNFYREGYIQSKVGSHIFTGVP